MVVSEKSVLAKVTVLITAYLGAVCGSWNTCISAAEFNESAVGQVDISVVHQELEGFGASGSHYENWLVEHPLKNEVYDVIFGQLDLDIYRIRNTYQILPEYIDRTAEIVQAAQISLGHPIRIMITSGSPPGYLKSNGSTAGGTLASYPGGGYMYAEFADWWADSLAEYAGHGIEADYVSIQNEPDWLDTWETCKFSPTETTEWAGYNLAFESVFQELHSRMEKLPKFLAPETMGFGGSQAFIDALLDPGHVYGYAHHFYTDGDYYDPNSFVAGMQSFAAQYGSKPLFQTECSGTNDEADFDGAMTLALHMHNSLVHEGVCSYLYWDLFWGDTGGLVTIEFPWQSNPGYTINKTYYAFRQYTAFTDPGWHRVSASTNSDDLRISAYLDPSGLRLSAILINTSKNATCQIDLSLPGFSFENGEIYRTSPTENCALAGVYDGSSPLLLPPRSITTLFLTTTPTTCREVQTLGLGLAGDVNGDCRVDLEDLMAVAGNWLVCNDPQNSNCVPTW